MIKDLQDVRREYGTLAFGKDKALSDPFAQFEQWFQDILKTENYDPTAMLLTSIDEQGGPDSRVVLLKGIKNQKLIFYTNYTSAKARQIDNNPQVSINFFWPYLARQVRIKGLASKLAKADSDAYFKSRPRLSQIAAIASKQSAPLISREQLEDTMNALIEAYGQEPIIRPDFWGGYQVNPVMFEFWQGRDNRLHDRLKYEKESAGKAWSISRLSP